MTIGLGRLARRFNEAAARAEQYEARAQAIYDGANPVQQALIDDDHRYIGSVCPRRSGKTFAVTSKVLYHAEKQAGMRILIISLTLKSTVENYWSRSPGGLWAQHAKYDLGIRFNTSSHTWYHENGSTGMLAGAETKADIEHLRGAAAEADIVVIDECKSFAPAHLQDLIDNVVLPGLMTRDGQLIMIGTPGSIPMGPFYDATCLKARRGVSDDNPEGKPTCIHYRDWGAPGEEYAKLDQDDWDGMYSQHHWTIEDNVAVPGQWRRALQIQRQKGWTNDNPIWMREFLGMWVGDAADLVYAYVQARAAEVKVNWHPDPDHGVTGLPPEHGPWHLLLGIDLGFVDDSALVLVAYSEQLQELRHVYDCKKPGLDSQAFIEWVLDTIDIFGQPDMIVADTAHGAAKMLIETLNQRYGLSIQPAEKRQKNEHIDLLNGDILAGRIKIIPRSDLEVELEGLQWDLSNDAKNILARTGRLHEDSSCPNHLCDALLYIWRWAYHFWAKPHELGPTPGTPEYVQAQEDKEIDRLIERRRRGVGMDSMTNMLARIRAAEVPLTRESLSWRQRR